MLFLMRFVDMVQNLIDAGFACSVRIDRYSSASAGNVVDVIAAILVVFFSH